MIIMVDLLRYFNGKPRELELYRIFAHKLFAMYPDAKVRVQKSQITFSAKYNFAFASLPIRRKKEWPKEVLIITFGLFYELQSPRITIATEAYPNRWTHHVLISDESQIDDELMSWIEMSYDFSESK